MDRMHPSSSLLGIAARGSLLTFIGTLVDKGFSFIIRVIVAHFFGAAYFGILVIGMMVSEFTLIFASIGLPRGGMRFLSVAIGSKNLTEIPKIFGTALLVPFFISLILSLALFLLSDTLSIAWFHNTELIPVFRVLALSIPFAVIVKVGLELSRGFNTTKYSVFIENLFMPVINIISFFLFYLLYSNFNSILYAIISAYILSAIVILLLLQRQLRHLMGPLWDRMRFIKESFILKGNMKYIAYSIPLFLTGFNWLAMNSVDIFMLGRYLDETYVGVYAAASLFASSFLSSLLIGSLNSILGPLVATQYGENAPDKIGYLYVTTTRWIFCISIAFSVFAVIARREIMLIFGKDFIIDGPAVLFILLMGNMVNCLTGGVGFILSMTGHQKKELATNSIALMLNVILNLLLIPRYGILGAAVAMSSSQILVNALRVMLVYKIFKVQPFTMKLLRLFIVGTGLVLLSFVLKIFLPIIEDYNIFFAIISLFIIIVAIRVTGLEKEDIEVIRNLAGKFMRPAPIRKIMIW